MEIVDVILSVCSAAVGGAGTFILQNKREKRDDYSVLIKTYQELYNEVKADQEKCAVQSEKMREEMMTLKQEVYDLRSQLKNHATTP